MSKNQSTVIAVFPNMEQAESAVQEMLQKGFSGQEVGVIFHGDDELRTEEQAEQLGNAAVKRTAGGAIAGGVLTGTLGALAAVVLPGPGSIIGAGLIAASGAIVGGFTGLMSTLGLPDEQVDSYRNELDSGHPLVVVQTNGRYSEALSILQIHGAYDVTREHHVSDTAKNH